MEGSVSFVIHYFNFMNSNANYYYRPPDGTEMVEWIEVTNNNNNVTQMIASYDRKTRAKNKRSFNEEVDL